MKTLLERLKAVGVRSRDQNWRVISQIWCDEYPPDNPKKRTLIEKILLSLPLVARGVSFSNLAGIFTTGGQRALFIDLYVISWVALLSVALFAATPGGALMIFLAVVRVVDIVSYQLCVVLVDSQPKKWGLRSVERSLLLALINLYEIAVAYAILYLSIGHVITKSRTPIASALQSLYFSFVTMTTLGYGEFWPADDLTRGLVICQLSTEVLYIAAVLPVLVGSLAIKLGARERKISNNTTSGRMHNP